MFTLFFGGKMFAPKATIKNLNGKIVNIQDFLQDCFFNSYTYLFKKLTKQDLIGTVVIGIESLNEPHEGFIGLKNRLDQDFKKSYLIGPTPTPLKSLLIGNGIPQEIDIWGPGLFMFKIIDKVVYNKNKKKVWLYDIDNLPPFLKNKSSFINQEWQTNGKCLWAWHGIYNETTGILEDPYYFKFDPIKRNEVNFLSDFWLPFEFKFCQIFDELFKNIVIILHPPVFSFFPKNFFNEIGWFDERLNSIFPKYKNNIALGHHWYDGATLINRQFSCFYTLDFIEAFRSGISLFSLFKLIRFGYDNITKSFKDSISTLIKEANESFNHKVPVMITETGIPFNMLSDPYFGKSCDLFDIQTTALDTTLSSMDSCNLSGSTIWNFSHSNSFELGDNWNMEDLSIYSIDSINSSDRIKVNLFSRNFKCLNEKIKIIFSPQKKTFGNKLINFIYKIEKKNIEDYSDTIDYTQDYNFSKNLSIIDCGGRAIKAFVRPYPLSFDGMPINQKISISNVNNSKTPVYIFEYKPEQNKEQDICILFLPVQHFSLNLSLSVCTNAKNVFITRKLISKSDFYSIWFQTLHCEFESKKDIINHIEVLYD